MKLSVIIPVYNEEDNIERIINLMKDNPKVEFIIIDGNSNDGTCNLLKTENINIVSSQKGRAIQLNLGASKASGDAFLFLHADCIVNEQHFRQIKTILKQGYIGGAFYTKTISFKNKFWDFLCRFADIQSYYNRIPFGDQGVFCTQEVFHKLQGFREDFPIFEDYDFSKRLKNLGPIKITNPQIIVSGRRYVKWGIIKSILIMKGLKLGYKLGLSTTTLKKIYRDIR